LLKLLGHSDNTKLSWGENPENRQQEPSHYMLRHHQGEKTKMNNGRRHARNWVYSLSGEERTGRHECVESTTNGKTKGQFQGGDRQSTTTTRKKEEILSPNRWTASQLREEVGGRPGQGRDRPAEEMETRRQLPPGNRGVLLERPPGMVDYRPCNLEFSAPG